MATKFSISKRIKSFTYAFNGLRYSLSTQHNFIIHLCSAIIAISLGFILKISHLEWISIIIVIGIVLTSEVFNTSIEVLVDLVSPEQNKKAGLIKDLAAGAVLISAISALVIGIIIFIPKIIKLL